MWFLMAVLILSTIALYYVFLNRNFLSPTFILFAMFIFCTFFAILGNQEWKVQIPDVTYVAIISGLFAFAAGEVCVDVAFNNGRVSRRFCHCENDSNYYSIPRSLPLIGALLGLIVFFMYFRKMNSIASSFGYSGAMSFMALSYAKAGLLEGASLGKGISTAVNLIYGIGFNAIFAFCYNINCCKKSTKQMWYILLPCIPQLLCYATSGSRNGFITIIVYAFFVYFITYYKTHDIASKRTMGIGKIMIIICGLLCAFYGLFQLLGVALGKTGVRTPLEMLYLYAGSSIPALGKYLGGGYKPSACFGNETFVGIVNWFHRFLGTPEGLKNFEHVRFANSSTTNIYTCFREYIDDFGYLGSIFLMFINGFLHKYYFEKIRKRKSIGLLVIIYSYFMYYHISSIFAASTTIYLLSNTQLSQFIWIVSVYLLMKKQYLKRDIASS